MKFKINYLLLLLICGFCIGSAVSSSYCSTIKCDWSEIRGGHDGNVENDMYWATDEELYQNCTWNYYSEEKIIYMINCGRMLDYVQLLKDGGWIPQDFVPSGSSSSSGSDSGSNSDSSSDSSSNNSTNSNSNTTTTPAKEYSEEEIENAWKESSRTESTCTAAGKVTYKNSITGKTKTEELPLLEHSYEVSAEVEPTCVVEGTRTFTCLVCGDSYTESIPMIDHDYQVSNVVEPICTEDGVVTYTCTMCSDSYEEIALASGHTTEKWEVTKEATLFSTGTESLVCIVCDGVVATEVIPALCPIPLWAILLTVALFSAAALVVVLILRKRK